MMIAELANALFETTLASSAAIVLVLCLHGTLMKRLGASVAYAAWALVPVAWLAVLLPAPKPQIAQMAQRVDVGPLQPLLAVDIPAPFPWQAWFAALWLLGAIACAARFWRQQRRFHRQLQAGEPPGAGLPAVVGVLRPRIVLPADFETRYSASERELILCHERIHIARGDLQANAIAAALRALHWFNPLLHYAAVRFRRDQELACDERVLARHPGQRRSYADAMLKTCMAGSPLPVACQWQASNPLKERIAMLKEHAPGPMRTLAGAVLVSLLFVAGGYAAWAAQPTQADAGKPGDSIYHVKFELTVEGETSNFEIREYAGKPFSFATTATSGTKWSAEVVARPFERNPQYIQLDFDLKKNGQTESTPMIAVAPGKQGNLAVRGEDGVETLRLSVSAQRVVAAGGMAQAPFAGVPATSQVTEASVDAVSKNLNPPRYPEDAVRHGVSGKVVLIVDVATDGSVAAVQVEKSQPAGVFDAAVLEAASKWKFKPAYEDGKPVAGRVRVPVDFSVDTPSQDGAAASGNAQGSAG